MSKSELHGLDANYQIVMNASELPLGRQARCTVNGEDVLLMNDGGVFRAVSYYCSHAFFPLEGGSVEAGQIICPYHGVAFCLKDGQPDGPPAVEGIDIFSVKVDDANNIWIGSRIDN